MRKGSQHDFHVASAFVLSRLTKLVYHSFQPLEAWDPRRIPSVPELDRAIESVLPEARDIDGRMRFLDRLRPDSRFRDLIELALKFDRVFGPDFNHRSEKLVAASA